MNRRLGISLLAVCAALVLRAGTGRLDYFEPCAGARTRSSWSTIPFTDRIDFGTLQDDFNQERGHRT